MIVDLRFNDLKRMATKGGTLLREEKKGLIIFYYVSSSPVIYRSIMNRPKSSTDYLLMLTSMPTNLLVLDISDDLKISREILAQLKKLNKKE